MLINNQRRKDVNKERVYDNCFSLGMATALGPLGKAAVLGQRPKGLWDHSWQFMFKEVYTLFDVLLEKCRKYAALSLEKCKKRTIFALEKCRSHVEKKDFRVYKALL